MFWVLLMKMCDNTNQEINNEKYEDTGVTTSSFYIEEDDLDH